MTFVDPFSLCTWIDPWTICRSHVLPAWSWGPGSQWLDNVGLSQIWSTDRMPWSDASQLIIRSSDLLTSCAVEFYWIEPWGQGISSYYVYFLNSKLCYAIIISGTSCQWRTAASESCIIDHGNWRTSGSSVFSPFPSDRLRLQSETGGL
jgi:hypothetical protein